MAAVLYGARGSSLTLSDLYTIDPATAIATPVGPIGFAMTGLVFDPTDGTLYGATSNNSATNKKSLITINPDTGAGTLIGAFGIPNPDALSDIACDSAGNLFGFGTGVDAGLYSIDKSTGAATLIGNPSVSFQGAITFDDDEVLWFAYDPRGLPLYTLDPATGAATDTGNLSGYMDGNAFVAFAFCAGDGLIYAGENLHDASPPNIALVTIDRATRVMTLIGLSVTGLDALAWSAGYIPPPRPEIVYARVYGIDISLSDDGVEQVSKLITSPDGF